ncbi:MAG TPA: hypothetical protein VF111_13155, partial [Thermoanaerobaculia bacterium]
ERKDKVLTIPVESVFKRDEQEIVYVKKAIDPKAFAEEAKQKKSGEEAKQAEKDAWKKFFDKRVVTTGLADSAKVEILAGLKNGEEVALEDPTLPKTDDEEEDD